MNLLIESVVLVLVIALLSTVATLSLGRLDSTGLWVKTLLILGPIVDGWLGMVFLLWLGLGPINAVLGGVLLGIASLTFLQPLLVPRRLVVWRLAMENIRRRKRQSALMIAGLVIASAIITSSLVVGDSLDATVTHEVEASWGSTDLLIAGFNPQTGVAVEFEENVGARIWGALQNDSSTSPHIEGRQHGLATSVSLTNSEGRGEPTVSWFARNSTIDAEQIWEPLGDDGLRFETIRIANEGAQIPQIVLNQAAGDAMKVDVGDVIKMGWYISGEGGQRVHQETNVSVLEIVANTGQGAMAGSVTPAVFTDLRTAQELMKAPGAMNRLSLALKSGMSDADVRTFGETVEEFVNQSLLASDVGFNLTFAESTGTATLSNSAGLGRISGEDVLSLRENMTSFAGNVSMMEVLQVPLIDVSFDNQSLLTLADSDVHTLAYSGSALWHIGLSGAGFEPSDADDSWVWRADDGERINDAAFSPNGTKALLAHDGGIELAAEWASDSTSYASWKTDNSAVAAVWADGEWFVLEANSSNAKLHRFDANLNPQGMEPLTLELPSTVLSYDLSVDIGLHLRVEGLLSTSYYATESLNLFEFLPSEAVDWPSTEPGSDLDLHPRCDNTASVSLSSTLHWCTFEHGLMQWNSTTNNATGIRLPIISEAPGFGQFPQMFLAFGGSDGTQNLEPGHVLLSSRLDTLALDDLSMELAVQGALPYAYGNDTAVFFTNDGAYASLPGFEDLSALESVVLGLISLQDAEILALAGDDERSLLLLSGGDFTNSSLQDKAFEATSLWLDDRSTLDDLHLLVQPVKVDAAEQAEASAGVLSAMFLVFGTFTMAAGVLLVLTIITLLADVRRSELATARALGLRISDARAFFIQEGTVLSLMAGGLGSLVGLGLAWLISIGFSTIFSSVGAQSFRFDWTLDSFLAGWIWGSLIALFLLWVAALWNSNLNIVKALRGARTSLRKGVPWGLYLLQILALGGAVLSYTSLFLLGTSSSLAYLAYVLGGLFLLTVILPVLTWQIPYLFSNRPFWNGLQRHAPRTTLGVLGTSYLLWTLMLGSIDPFRQDLQANELAFIVLGLFEVLAGVMVLTSFAPLMVQSLSKSRVLTKRFGAIGPVALAHPLAHPVRTAVVMGMFSITMFSVVVLSGYTAQFDTYSSGFVEEAEGEYELLLTSTRSRPIELGPDPDEWNISHPSISNIDSVGAIHRAPVHLEDASGERMPYILRGFDEHFSSHGGLPLHIWDEALGETQEDAWISIEKFDNIVFVDASFGLESTADGTTLVPLQLSIGDSISLIDFSNPSNTRQVTVGGFLKQSSYIFSPGVWMDGSVVEEQFGGEVTRMYVSVTPSAEASEMSDSRDVILSGQGKTLGERQAAHELEEILGAELASDGLNVMTVAEEVMVIQSLVLAILSLFEGFLALGLIVGIAGIGVVTVRNVSERRRTIGMLRAMGFRQRHVMGVFVLETSWVAVLGMLNGFMIGYGFHKVLYETIWASEGASFVFPWATTLMIFFFAWIFVILVTYPPTKAASRILPSAALRDR